MNGYLSSFHDGDQLVENNALLATVEPGVACPEAEKPRSKSIRKLVSKLGGPLEITMKAKGKIVAQGQVPAGISLHFSSNDCFEIGRDQASPVSPAYYDQAPFKFNGTIGTTKIAYTK